MKLRKVADRKKELMATILVAFIVLVVSIYVVYLVNHLTAKVYKVFGRLTDGGSVFTHFNFAEFEELNLRPKRATSTPAIAPVISPSTTSSTTATSSPAGGS